MYDCVFYKFAINISDAVCRGYLSLERDRAELSSEPFQGEG
jgi:hypothetical protein